MLTVASMPLDMVVMGLVGYEVVGANLRINAVVRGGVVSSGARGGCVRHVWRSLPEVAAAVVLVSLLVYQFAWLACRPRRPRVVSKVFDFARAA